MKRRYERSAVYFFFLSFFFILLREQKCPGDGTLTQGKASAALNQTTCYTKCFILGTVSVCYEGKLQTRQVY